MAADTSYRHRLPAEDLHPVILGLNHISAPVDLRDKACFSREEIHVITRKVLEAPDFHEVVVLSTCNRSEIYAVTSRFNHRESHLENAWCAVKNLDPEDLHSHTYYCRDGEAILHLFRVISSLDSMVIGENQILGQVKDAFEVAGQNSSVDFYFNRLFQTAFRVGKRVRQETTLNEGTVSISSTAVELARKVLGKNLKDRTVGVVGSGEMGELTAFHLGEEGVEKFIFFNRSLNNAEKLASRFGGEVLTLPHLDEKLFHCDIVVSSTAAREPVILKSHVERAIKLRSGKPMFLIDIAAPRDIEESVADIQNVFLFTIDDLKDVVGRNIQNRQVAADAAMKIIREESENMKTWYNSLGLSDVIGRLRGRLEEMVTAELNARAKNQPEPVQKEMEKLARCLMGKFLHSAVSGLKKMGQESGERRAGQCAEEIFFSGE